MYRNRKLVVLISILFVLTISLSIYPKETYADVVVTVIPYENQVVKGELLEVNVTVFDNGNAIGNARIKLTLKQLSKEFVTTQFMKLEPGIYKTTFNTTSLTIGLWNLDAEVQSGGDIYRGQSTVTITESPEREKSGTPVYLAISVVGICIVAVGLVYLTSTELMGKGKKRKKTNKKK